jgi:hypothetical protein
MVPKHLIRSTIISMRSWLASLYTTWGSIPRLLAQVHFSGLATHRPRGFLQVVCVKTKNLAVHFSGLELGSPHFSRGRATTEANILNSQLLTVPLPSYELPFGDTTPPIALDIAPLNARSPERRSPNVRLLAAASVGAMLPSEDWI